MSADRPGDRPDEVEKRWLDVSRIVFFNDAVFAIAMTVLVLNFRVPEGLSGDAEPKLARLLGDHWDDFLAYFVSFAVLSFYWVAHHRLFGRVQRADHRLLYLNLVFLAFIVLLPFPSELLQHYGDTEAAVTLWAAVIAVAGAAFTALAVHIGRAGLYEPAPPETHHRHTILRHATVPVVFAASIPVAIFNVTAAKLVWILVLVGFVVYRFHFGTIHDSH
ncbi:MAG: TMEM175 family protein [Acidimicrobiia bacterium]